MKGESAAKQSKSLEKVLNYMIDSDYKSGNRGSAIKQAKRVRIQEQQREVSIQATAAMVDCGVQTSFRAKSPAQQETRWVMKQRERGEESHQVIPECTILMSDLQTE